MHKNAYFCIFGALAILAGCSQPQSAEPGATAALHSGHVAKIAEAPDGTILWGVRRNMRTIYFASAGAAWREGCGKNCTRAVEVPTAADPAAGVPLLEGE